MPVWMVELFGSAQINRAFWGMNLLVMPFWLALIFAPRNRWVKTLSQPYFIPALVALVHHPLVLLVVWAHYLAVDLFLGMSIFRDAAYRRLQVPRQEG